MQVCLRRDINDDSDWAHLTSYGTEFHTEEEANERDRSPSGTFTVYRSIEKKHDVCAGIGFGRVR